jgi:tol-pal system protein YbgF
MRFSRLALPAAALWAAGALVAAGCAPSGYYGTTTGAMDSLLASQAEMMKRLAALERKTDATREAVQASKASTDTRLLDISQRLDVLEGKLEASGVKFSQLAQKVETVRSRMSSADSSRNAATGVPRDSTGRPDPEALYQSAYSDVAAGRYNLGREAFQDYLKYYPDTEVSDNAQYWIGECYFATGDFAGAIPEFQKVVKDYPKGDKVPPSMLKIGLCYSRLKNTTEATRTYKMLVQKYPKSPEAARAKELLAGKP